MGNFTNFCVCNEKNIIFQKSVVINVEQNENNVNNNKISDENKNFSNENKNFSNENNNNKNNNNNNKNSHDMFYFSKIENMTLTPIIQYLDTEIMKQKLSLIGENKLSQTLILNNNNFKRIQTIKYKKRKDLFDDLIQKSKSLKLNENNYNFEESFIIEEEEKSDESNFSDLNNNNNNNSNTINNNYNN